MSRTFFHLYRLAALFAFILSVVTPSPSTGAATAPSSKEFARLIQEFSSFDTRKTGTAGCKKAADFIENYFSDRGGEVGRYPYTLPVIDHKGSRLMLPDDQAEIPLHPLHYNAITPQSTPPEGLGGPLIYAGAGAFGDFNGKHVEGAIVLLDINSGKNWLNAASLGAKAVVFIDDG